MTNRNEREAKVMNKKWVMVLVSYTRWIVAVVGFACVSAGAADAQQAPALTPQFEVSGTYSYIRANAANSDGGYNLNGGSASFAYNFNDRFALVADGGIYRFGGLPSGLDSTMYTYLFGPRFTFRKLRFRKLSRLTPFTQVLLGGGRLNASASGISAGENGFSMAIGGGLDFPIRRRFSIRLIQAEYLLTRFDRVTGESATQNDVRISAGLVFRFGSK
jgi:outer membrane protein with beta-barrel domain